MAYGDKKPSFVWSEARGLMPTAAPCEDGPQGALIPDLKRKRDHVAVVYDKGDTPPKITVKSVSGSVHTVLANGVAVAIIASSNAAAPSPSEVILLERAVHPAS